MSAPVAARDTRGAPSQVAADDDRPRVLARASSPAGLLGAWLAPPA